MNASRGWLGDAWLFATLTFLASAIAAFGGAVLVAVVAVVIAAIDGARKQEEFEAAATTFWALLGTIVVSQLAMMAAAGGAWLCTRAPLRERLGFVRPKVSLRDAIVILIGGGVPFALAVCAAIPMPSFSGPDALMALWGTCSAFEAVLWVAAIALLPGFTEEVLYRGLIQRSFMRSMPPLLAILATSVCFALVHVEPPAMALALTLGLWFGVVAWRTGSIVLTVLMHMGVNALWNIAMFLVYQGYVGEDGQYAAIAVFAVITVPAFAWSIPILIRAGRTAAAPSAPLTQQPAEVRAVY